MTGQHKRQGKGWPVNSPSSHSPLTGRCFEPCVLIITRFEVYMLLAFIPYPIFLLLVIYLELTITHIRIVPLFPPYLLGNLTPQLYRGRRGRKMYQTEWLRSKEIVWLIKPQLSLTLSLPSSGTLYKPSKPPYILASNTIIKSLFITTWSIKKSPSRRSVKWKNYHTWCFQCINDNHVR